MVDNDISSNMEVDDLTKTELASLHLDNAVKAFNDNDLPKAILSAIAALEEATEWPLRGHILFSLATLATKVGDRKASNRYWTKFFWEVDGKEFPTFKLATAHYDAGLTCRMIGDYSSAIRHYQEALPTFKSEGRFVVECMHNLAFTRCIFRLEDDVKIALEILAESKPLCTTDEHLWHQLISEAFAISTLGRCDEAMAICHSLLVSSAGNEIKYQACFVAGVTSVDTYNKPNAEKFAAMMLEFSANNPRSSDLQIDYDHLQKLIQILD